jgi:hypothetical protein
VTVVFGSAPATDAYRVVILMSGASVAGSSGLLAYNVDTSGNHNTSGTSLADVDATNAVVTFTAPASGNVLVRLTGQAGTSTTAGSQYQWGLRESTTNIAGPTTVLRMAGSGTALVAGASAVFVITGLTPAASYTYKWAHASSAGTGILQTGASNPATMEVSPL